MIRQVLPLCASVVVLSACAPAADKSGDTGDAATTTDGGDTGETGEDTVQDGIRELSEPSGTCPDLSSSGFVSFESSGTERRATIAVPTAPTGPMSVVFFFHGLMDPGSTPQPTEAMADALQIQQLADAYNAVVVMPESGTYDLLGFSFFLWDIALESDADLVLFDDLRSCVADQLDVDLARTSAWGFSGGALWSTVMIAERGDAFATVVQASGGSDISVPIWPDPAAAYGTSAHPMPVLLMTGGERDAWPDPSLTIVDFEAATDTLEGQLAADDHTVVRCRHESGHTIPNQGFTLTLDWLDAHTFGEPSRWADGDLGPDSDWCTLVNARE